MRAFSRESLYLRFFHATGADPEDVERLVRVDPARECVLLAQLGDRVVAVGRYVLTSPPRAEAAFLVADSLQGRGIGTRLVEQLGDGGTRARDRGVHSPRCYGDNRR